MREKIIELLINFRMAGGPHSIEDRYAEIADYLMDRGVTILPEGSIILTKAEIKAMNTYSDKLRCEHITAAFDAVEELLQMAIKTEVVKAKYGDPYPHKYSKRLCQDLVEDMKKIERKLKD